MRTNTVFSIELSDEDLLAVPEPCAFEIEDLESAVAATPFSQPSIDKAIPSGHEPEVIEIELTAEEMDRLLSGL